MKKFSILILFTILMSLSLIACSSESKDQSENNSDLTPASSVTTSKTEATSKVEETEQQPLVQDMITQEVEKIVQETKITIDGVDSELSDLQIDEVKLSQDNDACRVIGYVHELVSEGDYREYKITFICRVDEFDGWKLDSLDSELYAVYEPLDDSNSLKRIFDSEDDQIPTCCVIVAKATGEELLQADTMEKMGDHILFSKEDKYGIAETDGTVVINNEYDELKYETSKYYSARVGDSWGLFDSDGNFVLPISYEGIKVDSEYENGENHYYFSIKSNGGWGLATTDGKQIIPNEYDSVDSLSWGDIFLVSLGGHKGIIDRNNSTIIPIQYKKMSFSSGGKKFYSDLATFYIGERDDGTVDFYNPDFKLYASGKFDDYVIEPSFLLVHESGSKEKEFKDFKFDGYNEKYFTISRVQSDLGVKYFGVGYPILVGDFDTSFLAVPCYYTEFTQAYYYALYECKIDRWLDDNLYSSIRICPSDDYVMGDVVAIMNGKYQYSFSRMLARDGTEYRNVQAHPDNVSYIECNEYDVIGQYKDGSGFFVMNRNTGQYTNYRDLVVLVDTNGIIVQDMNTGLYGLQYDGKLVAECEYSDWDYQRYSHFVTLIRGGTQKQFELRKWGE